MQDAKARAEDYDRHQRAEAGLEVGDGNAHQSILDAAQDRILRDKKQRSRGSRDSMYWFDIIQQQINDMQTLIDGAEGGFAAQYGEDWREQFAMRILDPDIMPQRENGESLAEYRARVEQALMDEMLNPDGTIKSEYKDHPEYGQLAQWAQWKHDQQRAIAFKAELDDPSLSKDERITKAEAFLQTSSYSETMQLRASSIDRGAIAIAADTSRDDLEDDEGSAKPKATENAFLPS